MRLYIVRHGETDWNKQGVFRGRQDVPLNADGQEQAKRIAGYLAARKITVVRSSPLVRASSTAEEIARAVGIRVETDDRLTDINYGRWEGKSKADILGSDAQLYRLWRNEPHLVTFPGGESLACVRERVMPVVLDLCDQAGNAVLVTHRVVCKVAICTLLGLGLDSFWKVHISTAAYSVFESERGRHRLLAHNIRPDGGAEDEQDF
ncbi:MAG: histidine phosphatase family protein [Planctomycetota bacterium]|nr:histidine phosphatase family protein [Planctomycetota bacterium]